jgi:uncharacterized protein
VKTLSKPIATLVIHAAPRAKQTEVAGMHGAAVRVRVAAPPVDGAANEELVRFLARHLGVARGAVTIVRGRSARDKTVTIEGMTTAAAVQRLLEAK